MSRMKAYLSVVLFAFCSFIIIGNAPQAYAGEGATRIPKGVFIDEVDISGMTVSEADTAIEDFINKLQSKEIAIRVGGETVITNLDELGYDYVPNNHINDAMNLGTSGNLIKRYKDLKDIEQGKVVFSLDFTIDEEKITKLVETKVSAYNIKPINATVVRKNGGFQYTDHKLGSKVEIAQTVMRIKEAVLNNWNRLDFVMDAVMIEDTPLYTRDIVEKCNALLGSFTTEYTSSAEGRAANLANGAKLINNTVLYPGEVFSGYEYLAPFTPQNGYYQAGAYSQGKIIDSIGGGACQVTTTLYNAVLFSELEIVERQSHSMTISYADLSRDAAIAGTYKDLKFKNNTEAPIIVEAYTKDRKITFNIWGYENRDSKRRIEYETVVISETNPPADVVTKDSSKPITYRKVTQSAKTGYKSELYKVIYEDDVEVSRELINKSSYAAAPRYVTVGTKAVEEKPKEAKNNEIKDKEDKPKAPEAKVTEAPVSNINPVEDEVQVESQSASFENENERDIQIIDDFIWNPAWDDEIVTE